MEQFAKTGDFCPNTACPEYGKLQAGQTYRNLRKFGKPKRGIQRYQCKTCSEPFTETRGTICLRTRTPAHEILQTLALLAEGRRISRLSRATGCNAATILEWRREAAQHAEHREDVLMRDFKVKRGQLDAMWVYVRNNGEKKLSGDR